MGDILIVDDERDIRELISDILKDEGFTTRLAGNSDECMDQVNEDGQRNRPSGRKSQAGEGALQSADVRRQSLHLPEALLYGFQALGYEIETFSEPLFQGVVEFLVHGLAHLLQGPTEVNRGWPLRRQKRHGMMQPRI